MTTKNFNSTVSIIFKIETCVYNGASTLFISFEMTSCMSEIVDFINKCLFFNATATRGARYVTDFDG